MATKTKAKKAPTRKLAVKRAPTAKAWKTKVVAINSAPALRAKDFWSDDDAAFFQPYSDRLKKSGL